MTLIQKIAPFVLVIFHIIGLVLFLQSDSASDLTWMNLTLCGLLVFIGEIEPKNGNILKLLLVLFIIFWGGFFIEYIGTSTGLLFGEYSYGKVLGWKWLGVSLIIGVNWYAIVLASVNFARLFFKNKWLTILVGAVLCVVMDLIIEPVAIKYGFWTWHNGEIPLFNYITWFIFATLFSAIYVFTTNKINKTAATLYVVWAAFFCILLLF